MILIKFNLLEKKQKYKVYSNRFIVGDSSLNNLYFET